MKRGYDLIAPIYDKLAMLFIGTSLRKAQVHFLHLIPTHSNILIVGGGTGWILEEITKVHHQNLCIDYVDVSAKMIALARKRNVGKNEVHFIQQSIIDFTSDKQYDVIITPFFFDNFKDETAQKIFSLLHQKLSETGLWLYTDFQVKNKNSYWQKAVLFMMYSFFRIAANIEAARLPDMVSQFQHHQYQLIKSELFLHHFIVTSAYKKIKLGS